MGTKLPGLRRATVPLALTGLARPVGWALLGGLAGAVLITAAGAPHGDYFDAQVQLGAAGDLLRGESPYGEYFQGPLWVALLLLPFAAVPGDGGYVAWFWANVVCWVAACVLIGRGSAGHRSLPLAAVLLLYPPVIWSTHGRLDGLMALGLALYLTLGRARPLAAGFALTALLVKPHLALFPLALVAFTARGRVLFGLAAGALLITCLSFAVHPGWLGEWLHAVANPPLDMVRGRALYAATVAAFAGLWSPGWLAGALAWAIAALVVILTARWIWRARPTPLDILAVGCAALFLVTPYAQGYDLSLLVFPIAAAAAPNGPRRLVVRSGVALLYLLGIAVPLFGLPYPTLVLAAPLALGLWRLARP